jgi:hypothetical protein
MVTNISNDFLPEHTADFLYSVISANYSASQILTIKFGHKETHTHIQKIYIK